MPLPFDRYFFWRNFKPHLQKCDVSQLEATSPGFFELFKLLKAVLTYCDTLKEINLKRVRLKSLENEVEESINVLQMLHIEQNQLEIELNELRQQHVIATNEKHTLKAMLCQTDSKLVK